jgi:hypothetical protein
MESQVEVWRTQARGISTTAGILAGGDGSARNKRGIINGAYRWGVMGLVRRQLSRLLARQEIRRLSNYVLWRENVDWAMASARSNTRAEQTHILAAMLQLFPVGQDVLYAGDNTGAIDN